MGKLHIEKDSVQETLINIQPWLAGAHVSQKGYMLGYCDLNVPSVSGFFRWLAKVGDGAMQMKIVRIDFAE